MRPWPKEKDARSRLAAALNRAKTMKRMREPAPDYPPDVPVPCSRPNRFYFAYPLGMVQAADVPEWAGIFEYEFGQVTETRRAPRLHEQKVQAAKLERLYQKAYHRFMQVWNENRLICAV